MAQRLVKQDVWIQTTRQGDFHAKKYATSYWAAASIDVNSPVMPVSVLLVKCKKCNRATVDVMSELLVVAVASRYNCVVISAITAVPKSAMRKYTWIDFLQCMRY